MAQFTVPARDAVSPANQETFDALKGQLGFVPNLYATFALSETALPTYLAFQNAKSSISGKSREVVNLVVSQVNNANIACRHTAIGKMVGFTDAQILELRRGRASFDARLDALAKFVKATAERRGRADPATVDAFLAAGWTQGNLVDVIVAIGDKIVSNYLHSTTRIPVDFPAAPALD